MNIASRLSEVPHPGEFIKDELDARGWLQRDLAYILGVSEQAINPIMSGKRGISPAGIFQLRKVIASASNNGMASVLNGLLPDEEIAKEAGFMTDSETFLNAN